MTTAEHMFSSSLMSSPAAIQTTIIMHTRRAKTHVYLPKPQYGPP